MDKISSSIKIEDLEKFDLPYTKEQLRSMLLFYDFIGYYENDALVGILIFKAVLDQANLIYIKVLEEFQKQGIASYLMQQYHRILGHTFTFFLEVHQDNQAAIKLYKKMGYRRNRIRKNYYPDGDGWEMVYYE